jgi:hypothetical protein
MIDTIIEDINKALDNEAYLAAMTLALTLPDICGKAMYPKKGTGDRYKEWYDEYIGKYERSPFYEHEESDIPYLSGKVVYGLRNSMLHEGSPNVDTKIIDKFVLVIEKKKSIDIYSDSSGITTTNYNNESVRHYRLNVRRFCQIIIANTKAFYNENREKFNFFNYSIMDWDAEIEKLHKQ